MASDCPRGNQAMCIHIKSNSNIFAKESTMSNTNQVPSNEQRGVPLQEKTVSDSPFIPLMLIGTAVSVAAYGAWDFYQGHQVISAQQIGTVQSVQANGGFNASMLIEVNDVYYPLIDTMAIKRGSPMILEKRANGAWFLCDEQHGACSRTSKNIPK